MNTYYKETIYSNTVEEVENMKFVTDSWLDVDNKSLGDIVVIKGDQEPEVKFCTTFVFTDKVNAEELLKNNEFYAHILFATAGFIGTELDSSDIHLVFRRGIPTNRMNIVQEMGKYGKNRERLTLTLSIY